MGGRADRGFLADNLRITKNKLKKQFCTAKYFLNRRATFLCMTPSNVREGCEFFLRHLAAVLENGTERRGNYE
jgi:hypothetical protein